MLAAADSTFNDGEFSEFITDEQIYYKYLKSDPYLYKYTKH